MEKKYKISNDRKLTLYTESGKIRFIGDVSKIDQTNVVYKINYNSCNSSYVGETKRTARIRSGEHKKQSINRLKDTPFFRHIFSLIIFSILIILTF